MTGMTMTDAQKEYMVEFLKANPDIMFSSDDIASFCGLTGKPYLSITPHIISVSKKERIVVVDNVTNGRTKKGSVVFFGISGKKKHATGTRCFYRWCIWTGKEFGENDFCPKEYGGAHELKFYGVDHSGEVKIPKRPHYKP